MLKFRCKDKQEYLQNLRMWRQILTVRKKGKSVKTMQESNANGKTCRYIWYSSSLNESMMPFRDP